MSETDQKLVAATHDFYQGQLARLDAITRESGVPRARLVRAAVDAYLARYEMEHERSERPALVLDVAA